MNAFSAATRRLSIVSVLMVGILMPIANCSQIPRLSKTDSGPHPKTPQYIKETTKTQVQAAYGKLPLYFIQNDGQVNEEVKFYEKGNGHATYFTQDGVYIFLARSQKSETPAERADLPGVIASEAKQSHTESIKLAFVDANKNPEIVSEGLKEGKVNYFIGNDPKKWKTNIPTYQAVVYNEIWPGIDIKFYGNNRQLEYDIIVKPGADPSRVRLAYEGIEGLTITENGDLEIDLKEGKILQKTPYIYQKVDGNRERVPGKFKIQSSVPEAHKWKRFAYGFEVSSYDSKYSLIIDPTLVYSSYLGGSGDDFGNGIAVDSTGNAYVTGETNSSNFPIANALQPTKGGPFSDVFVTKINVAGSALVYSTYLGGSGNEAAESISVDTNGNAYVTGATTSTNFPTTNAIQITYGGGGNDAFVAKINVDGNALVYSTYLGGSGNEAGWGITVDVNRNTYVTGWTDSMNFPIVSSLQATNSGGQDVFVTKINASGSALVYSTYLGGSGYEFGYSIAVDSNGNAYVTGNTSSTNFPTSNALQATLSGSGDAFVTKINATGSAFAYSTYLGGTGGDSGRAIYADVNGNAYVTGWTDSINFPIVSSLQATYGGSFHDAFVTKINSPGNTLVYSTYLGGNGDDYGQGISVDLNGNAYVTGVTDSTNFPLSSPVQIAFGGGADAFVTKINAAGNALDYSTYLGGSSSDSGIGIALDASGNAYVTGITYSANFPMAAPFQATFAGSIDAFVAKFSFPPAELPRTGQTTCYDTVGIVIPCAGTGQDGGIQAGVPWPSPRFTDNGDGTVTDNLTGMMWTKNANLPGATMSWQQSLDYVVGMNTGANSNFGFTDWRLPNINEQESLIDYETFAPALPVGHSFTNLQPADYWSSTTFAPDPSASWIASIYFGTEGATNKSNISSVYLWPVRSAGTGSIIHLPKTGQSTSYAVGDDGDLQMGETWPSPRFIDNGDGTVSDSLTGLMWSRDANLPGITLTWQQVLDYVAGMNAGTNPNFGHTDWRLPNRIELKSITDRGHFSPTLPSGYPFTDVQVGAVLFYWSSTSSLFAGAHEAYTVSYDNGGVVSEDKSSSLSYLWPVRGGIVSAQVCNAPGNTPCGSNVSVSPGSGTTTTFSTVSSPGDTTVTTSSTGPPIPTGFQLLGTYYDITTTATFTPPVTVCIQYGPPGDAGAQLFHFAGGTWVNVTTSNDTINGIICGQVNSLSPFFVGHPSPPIKPTLIRLSSFTVIAGDGQVAITWVTGAEIDNEGFNILKSTYPTGPFVRINSVMIPATAISPAGASYSFLDTTVENGKTYYYQLEDIDNLGIRTAHNTISATLMFAGSPLNPGQEISQAPASTGPSSIPSKSTFFSQILQDGDNTMEVASLEPSIQEGGKTKEEASSIPIPFRAISAEGQIMLEWTASDLNDGFNILRSGTEEGEYVQMNGSVISLPKEASEAIRYTYADTHVVNSTTYYYKLERVSPEGKSTFIGPIPATPQLALSQAQPEQEQGEGGDTPQ